MKYNLLLILTYLTEVVYAIVGIIHENILDFLQKCFIMKNIEAKKTNRVDVYL